LYNVIQPYKAQIPYWYPIPKIHKIPIASRPICEAFNAFTIYASQVINKVLKELYLSLLAKYPNLTSSINTICPDTNTAIHIPKAIFLIFSIYSILDIDPLHEFEVAITKTKNDSYNENFQKMQ
jgi:hypothetical protein